MTPSERKAAFRSKAVLVGMSAESAANAVCGVTWYHLSQGLKGLKARPLSAEVKAKFAAFIGRTVEEVFGPQATQPVVRRRRAKNVA